MKILLLVIMGVLISGCSKDHEFMQKACSPDGDAFDYTKEKYQGTEYCLAYEAVKPHRDCEIDEKANEFIGHYKGGEYCIALVAVRRLMNEKSLVRKEQYGRYWVHEKIAVPPVVVRKRVRVREEEEEEECRAYGCRSMTDQVLNRFSPVAIF